MKSLSMLLIAILFIQAFLGVEALPLGDSAYTLTQEDAEGNFGGLLNKHHSKRINCNYACSRRCIKSSRKNVCHRACKSCCATCNCVTPGTYGNKGFCPCYASLTTHGNKPKCP